MVHSAGLARGENGSQKMISARAGSVSSASSRSPRTRRQRVRAVSCAPPGQQRARAASAGSPRQPKVSPLLERQLERAQIALEAHEVEARRARGRALGRGPRRQRVRARAQADVEEGERRALGRGELLGEARLTNA